MPPSLAARLIAMFYYMVSDVARRADRRCNHDPGCDCDTVRLLADATVQERQPVLLVRSATLLHAGRLGG